ncbi:MAG: DUF4350 domain-containing protein [Polyangia bacterium]|jgi:hypothetical protein|nr:DUF4350 domain-containing protein [Polyangia bacterium]
MNLLALAILLASLVISAQALAAPEDYGPENPSWQGTSKLWSLAREQGYETEIRSKLDWQALGPRDVLFVVYPVSQLNTAHLTTWIQGGGRLILADDFGSTGPLLETLGVRRFKPYGQRITRLHVENPNLPLATAGVTHPLNAGIPELVTNHPAALDTELPHIFRFEPSQGAVVVAATLGKGRVVLVSDPSILINRMLEFDGNLAFARRLLGYLGRAGEDRLVVLIQSFEQVGAPKAAVSVTEPPPEGLSSIFADANDLLGEFNSYVLDRIWIMPIATLLAGLILALAVWFIPMLRPVYDASWTRPGEGPPPARNERDLAPYLEPGRRRHNYVYPAAVLRDVLDQDLEEALNIAAPLSTMDEHSLRRVARHRGGEAAERACARLVQATRGIPARDTVTPYTLTPRCSARDLSSLRDIGKELLVALGHGKTSREATRAGEQREE